MKVAVLILAHRNKPQLKRLISVLKHPSVDIYIHLDQKSSLTPADFQNENVFFTKKRYAKLYRIIRLISIISKIKSFVRS